MHKTRRFLPPLPNYPPGEYDLLRPQLRFISIPRENVKITNNFEELVHPLLTAVSSRSGEQLVIKDDHVVIPVHAIQVAHIQDKFPEAHIYPEDFNLPLLAQQSLRYVLSQKSSSPISINTFSSDLSSYLMSTVVYILNWRLVSSLHLPFERSPRSQHI